MKKLNSDQSHDDEKNSTMESEQNAQTPKRSSKPKSNLLINWRYNTVLFFLGVALVTLIGRAAYIQVIQPDNLIKQGDLRSVRVKAIPSARGSFLIVMENSLQSVCLLKLFGLTLKRSLKKMV